jgi:hypothetical protein
MKFFEDPTYIDMCRKAVEIQELAPEPFPEYAYMFPEEYLVTSRGDFYGPTDTNIWLPRLDQLIEMLGYDVIDSIDGLHGFINRWYEGELPYSTMEQAALAYLMETKYGKTWNGKEWAKI